MGAYMTALEMAGVSISLLPIDSSSNLMTLLDAPTNAHAWVASADLSLGPAPEESHEYMDSLISGSKHTVLSGGPTCAEAVPRLRAICERIIAIESQLTEMDNICGDGDCGLVMKAGAETILKEIKKVEAAAKDSASFCSTIADLVSASMGGTSGALIELMLRSMASFFASKSEVATWPVAISEGVNAMKFYGGATTGESIVFSLLFPLLLF